MSEEVSTSKPPAQEVRLRWTKLVSSRKGMMEMPGGSATLVGSKVYLAFNIGALSVLSFQKWRWKSLGRPLLGMTEWHAAVLVGDKIFYFGQAHAPPLVEYDIVLGAARKVNTLNEGPLRRPWKSCVLASWRNEIISFGGFVPGFQGRKSNETHALNIESKLWTKLEMRGELPPARTSHKALMAGTKMYIYGGEGESYQLLRHVWIAELGNPFAPFWSRPVNNVVAPTPLAAPAFNKLGDIIVVFGGYEGGVSLQQRLELFFMQTRMWQTQFNSHTKIEGEAPYGAWYLLSVNTSNGILYLTNRGVYILTED